MKIALIQVNPQSDFEKNVQNSLNLIRQSALQGAQVVVLPESFLFMGSEIDRKKFLQKIGENVLQELQNFAHELGIHLIAGSVDEAFSQNTDKFYNTCFAFSPTGQILSQYRKLHLFNLYDEAGKSLYCESDIYKFGALPQFYNITVQNDTWKALNIICYDIRFPEILRQSHEVYDIIFVPAAFTWQTGKDHWEILLRARAIENQCYVVACNQTGYFLNGQKRCYGNSMVVDPWGNVIARACEEEKILFCEISKAEIFKTRAKLPALADRKL